MRRIATVTAGTKSKTVTRFSRTLPGMKISKMLAPRLMVQLKRTKYQNSRRVAVPSILKALFNVARLMSRKFCMVRF